MSKTPSYLQVEPTSEPVRAVLHEVIDYAGLFPPASLDFETSVRYFGRYLSGVDRWMLRSFVCPTRRLPELVNYADLFEPHDRVRISVLGPAPSDRSSWLDDCEATVETADVFNRNMAGAASADTFELKLPAQVANVHASLKQSLQQLAEIALGRDSAEYFVEIVPDAADARTTARAVADLRQQHDGLHIGLKIRTGGITPDAIPSALDVARFICACRDYEVPFKATAGLHHPIYHFSHDVGTEMHGFLNVFVGTVVASVHRLGPDQLADLLVTSSPPEVRSAGGALMLDGHRVSIDDIVRHRKDLVISFGSCSFDDPRNDLLELGLVRLTH